MFTYARAGPYGEGKGPEDLGADCAAMSSWAFTAVKMKVGGAPLEEDVARGPGLGLRITPDDVGA